MDLRGYFPDAPVDPTDARNAVVRFTAAATQGSNRSGRLLLVDGLNAHIMRPKRPL
jgi:hypothetical protein